MVKKENTKHTFNKNSQFQGLGDEGGMMQGGENCDCLLLINITQQ